MITWPELTFGPINLWSMPYAYQGRRITDVTALDKKILVCYNSSLSIKKERLLYVRRKIWEVSCTR